MPNLKFMKHNQKKANQNDFIEFNCIFKLLLEFLLLFWLIRLLNIFYDLHHLIQLLDREALTSQLPNAVMIQQDIEDNQQINKLWTKYHIYLSTQDFYNHHLSIQETIKLSYIFKSSIQKIKYFNFLLIWLELSQYSYNYIVHQKPCQNIIQHILIYLNISPSLYKNRQYSIYMNSRKKNSSIIIQNPKQLPLYIKYIYITNYQKDNIIHKHLISMISKQLIEHITQIRRTDNDRYQLLPCMIQFQVDHQQYFQHLQLLLEVYIMLCVYIPIVLFIQFCVIIGQQAQRLQYKNTTKYLAKKYFDIYLCKYPQFWAIVQDWILVIITCLRTAAKFNQTVQVCQLYTIQFCIQQAAGKYKKQHFIKCQIQLIKALSFRMRMTSPYQFIIVKCLLPHLKHAMNILNCMIDFALSLPQLRVASAEGIFFGALLYSCRQKKQLEISYEIIKAITYKWEQAIEIANILQRSMKKVLEQ